MNYITFFKKNKLHTTLSIQSNKFINKMFAGALKTINSKYFKNIAKNTKDLA